MLLLPIALLAAGINRLLSFSSVIPNVAIAIVASFVLWWYDQRAALVTVVAWWPLTWWIRRTWHKCLPSSSWQFLRHGGPLGPGCSKVVESTVAEVLWLMVRGELPDHCRLFHHDADNGIDESETSIYVQVMAVLAFSALVALVLHLWSTVFKSKGEHPGVNDMVSSSKHSLSFRERGVWLLLALVNAASEELTSRGFWRAEFETTGQLSPAHSNIAQALLFGAWHFRGIPSGWAGVALTFVYGWIMGWLSDWSGGNLLLPILSHTLADYYIFTVIAQQKAND